MYRFNWLNLFVGLIVLTFVDSCLASLESPGIAYIICGICVAIAFPWIERIDQTNGDKNGHKSDSTEN